MLSRRTFLKLFGGGALSAFALGSYAFAIEPMYRLRVATHRPKPANWPDDLSLKIACISDVHACNPWVNERRLQSIVRQTNALKPDLIVLLGDYVSGMRLVTSYIEPSVWAPILTGLDAPLGRFAILGNHDWWEDARVQETGKGPPEAQTALEAAGVPVLENQALKLNKNGKNFWLAGLGDQLAFTPGSLFRRWKGQDDLDGTLSQITDENPIILLAHEPDIFVEVPERVSLTLSGHTHGGQVNLFGYTPVVPSRYGSRFAYGHIVEENRHLVVSGGLGCSILPVRFGSPPEITVVELGEILSAG